MDLQNDAVFAPFGRPSYEPRTSKPLSLDRVQQLLGARYSVVRELGAGGTSIVFLANDLEGGSPVAVKVLRPELSIAVVAARFLREIEIGRRLSHPNVLPISESGSIEGELFCIMPFVDGETLRERLVREGCLSIEETLRIARAVADALDYAHSLDLIHRDIKPANILIDHDRVIVADFGMARAMTAAASGDLTETGLAIGTANYMSPEQAGGQHELTGRTDVYSLACVVYEMLAGEPPFTGPTSQAIIARHQYERPRSLCIVRPSVPVGVERVIEKALAKVPADRFATAGQFVDALDAGLHDIGAPATKPENGVSSTRQSSNSLPWIVVAIVGLIAIGAGFGWWRAVSAWTSAVTTFAVEPPAGLKLGNSALGNNVALSRDGRMLAFLVNVGPQQQLYLRRLDQLDAIPLPMARGASDAHFSADGRSLAYTTSTGPTTVSLDPRNANLDPTKLALAPGWKGIAWTYSSDVFYVRADTLWRVSEKGGTPRLVASMDTTLDISWKQPTMLPGGRTIVLRVTPRGATSVRTDRIVLISVDDGVRTDLHLESQGAIGYLDDALIFSTMGGRIMAVKFDIGRGRVVGEPVALVDSVQMKTAVGAMAAVSDNGTLAYLKTTPSVKLQINDGHGAVLDQLPEAGQYFQTVWSPDGTRIAMYVIQDGTPDIWVYNVESHAMNRLTRGGGYWPVWTPDGKRILYIGWGLEEWLGGVAMSVAADGSSPPEPIAAVSAVTNSIQQLAVSTDGKYILGNPMIHNRRDGFNTLAFPYAGGRPLTILNGTHGLFMRVSPDGKWLAYSSSEGGQGRMDVFVSPFPGSGPRTRVSANGGSQPRWSSDGRRLFYRDPKGFRVATLDLSGAEPRVLRTDSLLVDKSFTNPPIASWDVHPDGKTFVLSRDEGSTKLIVVENWRAEVRKALTGK